MSIGEQIVKDIKAAMVAKDTVRLGALRLMRAEMLKAEKEKGQPIDEQREMAILKSMVKQRRDSIEQFEKGGRQQMADAERAELAIIEAYLPQSLTLEQIDTIIGQVLAETGSSDASQLGKVMGQIMGKLKQTGQPFDGKTVNERVRERLGA